MDSFSQVRLTRLLKNFKSKHGRDISKKELEDHGFSSQDIKGLVKNGLLKVYQVHMNTGAIENRYKINQDWKTLNG